MPSSSSRATKGAIVVLLTTFAVMAVHAQSTAGAGALEEIVVTAQKREQNSQDIGISLSAVSGADLSSLGATTASDITRDMPAVVLTQPNGPSSFSLAIRGVTQNDFADHQESPAAIYVDDVYVSQMAGLAFSLFDMDRVEVLRGPQGTLFGRNATGGLANFVTRKPTSEDGGFVDITFGERNLTRVEGAVNGSLTSDVDGRFSFLSNHYDPVFRNSAGGAADGENGNDWALRGQILWRLPNSAELLLNLRASREDVHAGSWEEFATKPSGNGDGVDVPVGPNDSYYGCPGCNATGLTNSGPFVTRDNISGFARLKSSGFTAKYTQNLGFAALTVIGDYSHLSKEYQEDSDASPYTLFQFFNGSQVNQESVEARLNGGNSTFNWTGGVYGLRIHGDYYEGWEGPAFFTAQEFNNAGNPNGGYVPGAWPYGSAANYWTTGGVPGPDGGVPATVSPYTLVTKSYAAFGQVEWRFTDLIGFTLGARFTRDQKDYGFQSYPYEYFPSDPSAAILRLTPLDGAFSSYSGNRSDNLWAGKAQVDFHLTKDMLAYLSYNRGVKGGGFNAPLFPFTINDVSTLTFKPETLTSYEAGFKSEFLDHTLRFNAAAYFYDYKNYQALIYTLGLEQLIVNANAVHTGGEMEVEWAPSSAWRFSGGLAYVDALVKNVPARCCTDDGAAISGNFTPGNAPRWTANAMARYTLPVPTGKVAFQLDGNYLTKFYFNLSDLPVVQQSGYGIANVRINYSPLSDKWEVGASVDNLANKHYGVMGFDNTSINGMAQFYPGMPRWWKLHLNYKF